MSRLFLVRHGEPSAAWGDAADPGLSPLGLSQAEAAAAALAGHGPLLVVSSPMARCRETAAPYARQAGVEPRIEPRVSEVSTPADIADRRAWLRETFPWAPGIAPRMWTSLDPALHAWRSDVLAALDALDQDAVVFTHFIAINAIVSAVTKDPHTIACRPGHASITELARENGVLRLVELGAQIDVGDVR